MSQLSHPDQRQPAHARQADDGTQPHPQPRMFPTQHYLSRDVRMRMVNTLNQLLADATDLMSQAKFAHWNVRGREFYQLHELFDELAEAIETHVDMIAERAAALGGQAMGTVRLAASNSRIPEPSYDAVSGQEFVQLVVDRLSIMDTNLFHAIGAAEAAEDRDTADMLNEISREIGTYLWFLEAHLQNQPVASAAPSGQSTPQGGQ